MPTLWRRFAGALLFVAALAVSRQAGAQAWQKADPSKAGWSIGKLEAAKSYSISLDPTAVMIVQDGKIIADWGDISHKVDVASVRKSLLSALYGIAVSEERIDLSTTLAELDIDDTPPSLTAIEKTATVRDLLMARSGVYHPAAYETDDIRRNRPARGSHAPGTFWFYNNWDFNVLGTIYQRQTGEDIFESFENRIARPIGMEDFSARDGRYVFEELSQYPAYPFHLSARDAARFGQLFLNGGRWADRQIVPASWIRESTNDYSLIRHGEQGYGYMWWLLPSDVWGPNAAYAAGSGGQYIAFVPSKRLVVVQTVDLDQNPEGIRTSSFIDFLKQVVAAAP